MVQTLLLAAPSGRVYEQVPTATARAPAVIKVECFSSTPIKPTVVAVCMLAERQVALVDSKGTAYICNLDQNRYRRVCSNLPSCQGVIALEGETLALSVGKEAKVYRGNGQLLTTLRGHKDKIEGMDVNFLRKWLLTQSQDTLIIWEIASWARIRTVNTEAEKFVLCRFTPDSQSLVVNLKDGSLYQMGLAKFATEKVFKAESGVRLFCCTGTNTQLFAVTTGAVFAWDCSAPQSPHYSLTLPAGISAVTQIALVNEKHLAMLADNGIVYIVNVASEKAVGELRADGAQVVSFSCARGGFCYRASDGSATVIDWAMLAEGLEAKKAAHVQLNKTLFDVPQIEPEAPAKSSSQPSSSDHSVVIMRKDGLGFDNLSTSSQSTEAPPPCQHKLFSALFATAKLDPEQSRLQHCNLRRQLHHLGAYPAQFRVFVWRFLLQLPNNKEAFEGLYSQGMHPALAGLHQNPLLKSAHVYAKLERVLSALTYWSPIFGQAEFVPGLLQPLAVVCRGDDLSYFEVAVALFLNWLQHWLEFYPTPPLNYLQSIDNLIKFHQPKLHAHFQTLRCSSKAYIWPSLRHLFSSFLGLEGVTQMYDFIFTDWDKPQLLIFFSTALIIKHKNLLLKMTKGNEISAFFTKARDVNVKEVAGLAFALFNETPGDVAIVGFDQNLPIPQGQYPLFTGYPKFVVEERQGIRDEILQDEERLLKKETTLSALTMQIADFEAKEKLFSMRKEQMTQLDKEWRGMAQMEEQLRAQERLAFEKQVSIRKQTDLKDMETRFQQQVDQTKTVREQELKMLEKELARGGMAGQYTLEAQIADEALRAMEQRAVETIQQTIDQRTKEELNRRQFLIESEHKEQSAFRDRLTQAQWEHEDEAAQLRLQLKCEREQKEADLRQLTDKATLIDKAQKLKALEHELKLIEVEKERRLRQLAEDELERGKTVAAQQEQKRSLLAAEEARHFSDLKRREEFHEKRLAEERQNQLQATAMASQKELLVQQDEIQRLEREKQRKEAEGRLIDLRKQSEQRALEGEKQFQAEVLQMDIEARERRQANLEKLFAQKEEEEKLYFQRVIQNERAGLDRIAEVKQEARTQQLQLIEQQRQRALRAQEELAKARREQIQQENDIQRMRMVAGSLQPRQTESPLSSKSSSSEAPLPSQNHSRRAVTFHSTYTSPDFTNHSPNDSAHEECSSCQSSGLSTPPLPTRSARDEEYSSELSDGSELVLSHSGTSISSKYSSLSSSRR